MTGSRADRAAIGERLEFVGLDEAARARLEKLEPVIATAIEQALDSFYAKRRSPPADGRSSARRGVQFRSEAGWKKFRGGGE